MRSKPLGVVTIYCSFIFFAKYIAVVSTYDNALFFFFFILYFLQQMPNNCY